MWRGHEFVPTPSEGDLYRALGLAEIPPELREGRGEIEAAAAGALPALLERSQLRGLLHCHTNYSDGSNTVEELAVGCQAAGYAYVGLTDHSQAAAYAGGLGADDLARQADEVDAVNRKLDGIRVLKGIEADILVDGRIDYDEAVLGRLDFVIASIHSRFNLNAAQMTARMLAAMDNPFVTIIGHPTGRLLQSRDPYAIDLDAVFEKAAACGVAMEINADPHRLDLDWRTVRAARSAGVTDLDRRGRPQRVGHSQRGLRRWHRAQRLVGPGRRPECAANRGVSGVRPGEAPMRGGTGRQRAGAGSKRRGTSLARAVVRAPLILERLRAAYPDARTALDHANPYQLLTATILSAQTTDVRVNLVTPALFARYPDPFALARARQSDVEKLIQSTGFFRNKAKSIIGMAQALVAEHGGEVPRTMEALVGLPGVGRKTANVVLGNAFGVNEGVVVDTHVTRLSLRLGFTRHANPVKIEQVLMRLFPASRGRCSRTC